MKELNSRGLQEDFYKIVANNLEIEVGNKKLVVFESREPLVSMSYKYSTDKECEEDFNELLKYKQLTN